MECSGGWLGTVRVRPPLYDRFVFVLICALKGGGVRGAWCWWHTRSCVEVGMISGCAKKRGRDWQDANNGLLAR